MSIEDLGNIGELIAALATVATLVYLAIQIRQNTTSSRTATYQAIVSTGMELGHTFARDESFADLFSRGLDSPESLSGRELIRLTSHIAGVLRCYELVFHQFHHGAIDEATWMGWRLNMVRFLRHKAYSDVWHATRDEFPPAFRAEVERALEENRRDEQVRNREA